MAKQPPHPTDVKFQKGPLAVILGSGALAALVMGALTTLEGKRNVAYRDIVGIATACRGTTGKDIVAGRYYTDAECDAMDEKSAVAHAQGVLRCTSKIKGDQLVAATLLTYNIGVGAYCGSTVARRFNAGDLKGGCDAFTMWVRAGGKVVQGLVNRRRYERAICLRGLT